MSRSSFFISCVLALQAGSPQAAEETTPEPAVPVIAAASPEGEIALRGFQVERGLVGQLFAAEPLLANPVSLAIDERGRVFVCESFRQNAGVTDNRGHDQAWLDDDLAARTVADRVAYHRKHLGDKVAEYERQDDRLRLLVDDDGDGRADRSTVFADHFNQLAEGTGAGVLAHRGQVYYTCIPNLWRMADDDGDGRADSRQVLHTGYGVRVAFRGHDLHGLCLGPDRRLYFSVGDRGYHVVTPTGELSDPESGAVFRCRLDGSELEVFATGLRNPQELAFDDFGNLFTGDNNSDSGDRARWVFVVPGGDTGWRMAYQYLPDRGPFNREKIWHPAHAEQPAYIVPPVTNFADGPSGLAYYPGVGLPESFRGRFLLCDFRGGPANSGIRTFRARPKGAFFELADEEQPIWKILATDLEFGPDGALYVCDWVNGWNGEGKGRIYRFTSPEAAANPLVAETRQLLTAGLGGQTTAALRALLGHADRRVRQLAQFELVDRRETNILAEAATANPSQLARIHAIWGLGMSRPLPVPSLRPLLRDPDAEIRAQAALVLGDGREGESASGLMELLQDDSARVQYHAALALGRIGSRAASPALAELLQSNADQDPIVRHGAIMGLTTSLQGEDWRSLLHHPSSSVRVAVVVALRKQRNAAVAEFLRDPELRVALEAARAVHDLPLPDAWPQLAAGIERETDDDAWLRRALNAHFRLGTAANAAALVRYAGQSSAPLAMRLEALSMLADWGTPSARDRVLGMWRPLPRRDIAVATAALRAGLPGILSGPPEVRNSGAQIAANLGITEAANALHEILRDQVQPGSARADALVALSHLEPATIRSELPANLRDSAPEVRIAARGILFQFDAKSGLEEYAAAVDAPSRLERHAALAALGAAPGVEAARLLDDAWRRWQQGSIPADTRLDVLTAAAQRSEPEWRERVAAVERERLERPLADRFPDSLVGGDTERGRRIFFERTSVSCVRCHKVRGRGGDVGPDLSQIAVDKKREYLLEAIVDPNRAIAKGFESVTVVDDGGRIHVGVVRAENDASLQLITADGKSISLDKNHIEERQPAKSPMPEDLIQKLSPSDLRDLVEFLAQLRQP